MHVFFFLRCDGLTCAQKQCECNLHNCYRHRSLQDVFSPCLMLPSAERLNNWHQEVGCEIGQQADASQKSPSTTTPRDRRLLKNSHMPGPSVKRGSNRGCWYTWSTYPNLTPKIAACCESKPGRQGLIEIKPQVILRIWKALDWEKW